MAGPQRDSSQCELPATVQCLVVSATLPLKQCSGRPWAPPPRLPGQRQMPPLLEAPQPQLLPVQRTPQLWTQSPRPRRRAQAQRFRPRQVPLPPADPGQSRPIRQSRSSYPPSYCSYLLLHFGHQGLQYLFQGIHLLAITRPIARFQTVLGQAIVDIRLTDQFGDISLHLW